MSILDDIDVFGIGDRCYVQTGKSQQIGSATTIGDISKGRKIQKVTLIVGLDRGRDSAKERTICRQAPKKIKPKKAVDTFLAARITQLGRADLVGATVTPARGQWKGGGESTRVFDVIFDKSSAEKDFKTFKNNMLRVGEVMSDRLCQDKVLAVVEDGTKRTLFDITRRKK